ncbi:MAG: NCS2 family permease [Deltaproteobacteria bacterium]|nr:NCS2 family permease [Deltaproteobacteria bacterium]
MLERIFRLREHGTNVRTEVVAGLTTFAAMAYIVFVNPAILSLAAGGPSSIPSLLCATCLAAAFGTLLMAFGANYPVALAPGMGENIFFVGAVLAWGLTFEQALGVIFLSGLLFLLLTLLQIRQRLLDAVPDGLKFAIAAGIGLLIAFVGLADAGIVVRDNGGMQGAMAAVAAAPAAGTDALREQLFGALDATVSAPGFVRLGDLTSPPTLLALFGLGVTLVLVVRKVRGAILWGIAAATVVAWAAGLVHYAGVAALPAAPPVLRLDLASLFSADVWARALPLVGVFLFMDVFDTMGTLIGVGERAGLMRDGRLPRANRAMLADAGGTMAGALLGTSTVTSFVESAAGVQEGGRTGLTAVVVAVLFVVAAFLSPLVAMVGGGVAVPGTLPGAPVFLQPITAAALIIVGAMMVRPITKIDWDDWSEAFPAFVTVLVMPLTLSIAHGIAAGFVTYDLAKLAKGEARRVGWVVHVVALLCVARYAAEGFAL